jgi:uncharacterized protein YbjQ (UPF0145 family)
MLIVTTDTIQGQQVAEYLGLVAGQAIYGANIFRDFFAGITDVIGGRSGGYESVLMDGASAAIKDMEGYAEALGANAIIGVSIDYESMGKDNSMLMVSVTGTAVKYA